MQMDKITYRSKAGDMDIPAFVFQPLKLRGDKGHPAIVWVHENIPGISTSTTSRTSAKPRPGVHRHRAGIPGSLGYGKEFYDAIDYGGNEVDDVVTAAEVLKANSRSGPVTHRDHGLEPRRDDHAAVDFPEPDALQVGRRDGAGDEPVSAPRVERRGAAASGHRSGEPVRRAALERHDIYKDRSPLYSVDKLQIPLYVGVTRNDDDVNIEEDMQLVDALRSRKSSLAETMVYDNPPAGTRSIGAWIRRRGSRRTHASSAIPGTASGRSSTGTSIPSSAAVPASTKSETSRRAA